MSATGDPVRARVIEVVVGVLRELELELWRPSQTWTAAAIELSIKRPKKHWSTLAGSSDLEKWNTPSERNIVVPLFATT
jgi:hypothetical protein